VEDAGIRRIWIASLYYQSGWRSVGVCFDKRVGALLVVGWKIEDETAPLAWLPSMSDDDTPIDQGYRFASRVLSSASTRE
jgi:hypothetical protein